MKSKLMSFKLILHSRFSYDVTTASLLPQNNDTAARVVSRASPVGIELFFYVYEFLCSNKFVYLLTTWVKTLYLANMSARIGSSCQLRRNSLHMLFSFLAFPSELTQCRHHRRLDFLQLPVTSVSTTSCYLSRRSKEKTALGINRKTFVLKHFNCCLL